MQCLVGHGQLWGWRGTQGSQKGFWFVLVDSFGSTLLALHVGLLAPQLFWRSLAFKAVQAETGSAMLLKTHNEHAP